MHIHRAQLHVNIVPPDGIKQLLAAERLTRMLEQEREQIRQNSRVLAEAEKAPRESKVTTLFRKDTILSITKTLNPNFINQFMSPILTKMTFNGPMKLGLSQVGTS